MKIKKEKQKMNNGKMIKGIISFLGAVSIVFFLQVPVLADPLTDGNFEYELDDDSNASITGYVGTPSGSLIIPSTVGGHPVKTIGWGAFAECSDFTGTLTIPKGVRIIEGHAFNGCSGFTGTLVIPDSVEEIGECAFDNCSSFSGDLIIPDSVSSIGSSAFYKCSGFSGKLVIPDSVTDLGGEYGAAFSGCSGLTGTLKLPKDLTEIKDSTFSGCKGLTGNFSIPAKVTSIGDSAFEGCSSLTGNLKIPEGVTYIGEKAFYECSGLKGNLPIPDSVTNIGNSAFHKCNGLTGDLIIPDSVTYLGYGAFADCSFDGEIYISKNITRIEAYAFSGLSKLTGNLIIPEGVTYIGQGAFSKCCGLTGKLRIPDKVVTIDGPYHPNYSRDGAFFECTGFTELELSKSLEYIGIFAFFNCEGFKGSLTIPDSVKTVDEFAFGGCSGFDGNLLLPNGLEKIKNHAFSGCEGFTGDLFIPDSVTEIERGAFYGNGFNGNLRISNNITEIKQETFSRCRFTGELVIPEGVKKIEDRDIVHDGAFEGCEGFTSIMIPNTLNYIGYQAFYNCSGLKGDLIIPDSVDHLGYEAFRGCTGLNGHLKISANITEIGYGVFRDCGFTGELVIPNKVEYIYGYIDPDYDFTSGPFQNCKGFTSLSLPDSLKEIGDVSFIGCSGFKGSLKIPKGVTYIGRAAFKDTSFSGGLVIPDSVEIIDGDIQYFSEDDFCTHGAFENCKGFTSLSLPVGLKTIGDYAFCECSGFTGTLTIPEGVTYIGEKAFYNCSGFTSLTIPSSVTKMGEKPFEGASGLKEITNKSNINIDNIIAEGENNLPSNRSEVTRGKYKISYNDRIPFAGRSKIKADNFGGITVSFDDKVCRVTKIKVDKKKKLIQITGLEGADKDTVKSVKKSTKGKNRLPFTFTPYHISNNDDIRIKRKKNGDISTVKIMIGNKLYKAKKKKEWSYDKETDTITFFGNNLTGSAAASK